MGSVLVTLIKLLITILYRIAVTGSHSHRMRGTCSFPITGTPPPPYLGEEIHPLSRMLVTSMYGHVAQIFLKWKSPFRDFSGNLSETPTNQTIPPFPEKNGTCMQPPHMHSGGGGRSYSALFRRFVILRNRYSKIRYSEGPLIWKLKRVRHSEG